MKFLKYLLTIGLLIVTGQVFAHVEIKGIRIWPSPESTRVVFDLNKSVKYQVQSLESPDRVIIDFEDAKLIAKIAQVSLGKTGISKIRSGRQANNNLRIVLELNQKIKPKYFLLAANEVYGPRLVIDLESNNKQQILALFDLDAITKVPKPQDFIIAIDPGHGGEDPGAVGPRGTKEKDVALAIARHLKDMINQQPGMDAFLTRNGDYYIGLRERMRRARNKNADLFISIHADAYNNTKADGASVFVLTSKHATSEAARWLAASENRADLVGGVSLDDKSDVLASVLLDLSQTANAKASLEAASVILRSLGKNTNLHKPYVEKAGFMVLRAPDVPSILVESGFISNPKTELKLRDKHYQQKIAGSIMQGIQEYFKNDRHRHRNSNIAKQTY